MTNKSFHKVCVMTIILALSACQGAYKTTTGKAQPVLDIRAAEETPLEMKTISTGGIIMKRTYDKDWAMPQRDVDTLRAEFTTLQKELLALTTGQERKIIVGFGKVEQRVAQLRREEMRKAAKDAELMVLVKSKFDIVDKNIAFLKASEVQQISEKDNLLSVLDDKFQAVEGRLVEMNKVGSLQNQVHKEEISLALQELAGLKADKNVLIRALDKKFSEVETNTNLLSTNLKDVSYEQDAQKRIAVARKQAMKEARELRFLEELALRKKVEEARRGQISAIVRRTEKEKFDIKARDYEREKEQAIIEVKMATLREKLKVLEVKEAYRLSAADDREKAMKENLEIRLSALKETYDVKFSTLQKERDDLNKKLLALNESSVRALSKQRNDVNGKITALIQKQDDKYKAQFMVLKNEKDALEKRLKEADKKASIALIDQRKVLEDKILTLVNSQGMTVKANKKYKEELKTFRLEKIALEKRLKKMDENTVVALQKQRLSLEETIENLKGEQQTSMKDLEEYRGAIEERVFAMESQRVQVENEAIQPETLTVGRLIESGAQLDTIKMTPSAQGGIIGGYPQEDWIDIEDYQIVLHENNSELSNILRDMLKRAEPYIGPWQVRWKLKNENMDVLKERFSLDVETDFDAFSSYISNYMKGYRGFGLTFNIFRAKRILVITD